MLRIVMSLLCRPPPDPRRFAGCHFKGHTRAGHGLGSFPVFRGFGAKVTENKRVALCKGLIFFRIVSCPVHPCHYGDRCKATKGQRHCEEPEVTWQSRAARGALDCFAALAMTGRRGKRLLPVIFGHDHGPLHSPEI